MFECCSRCFILSQLFSVYMPFIKIIKFHQTCSKWKIRECKYGDKCWSPALQLYAFLLSRILQKYSDECHNNHFEILVTVWRFFCCSSSGFSNKQKHRHSGNTLSSPSTIRQTTPAKYKVEWRDTEIDEKITFSKKTLQTCL